MSIYRHKLTAETKELIAYLEQNVFHKPIQSVRQFAHGAASYNYLIAIDNQKYIIKLTHTYNQKGIERLTRICASLSQNEQLSGARLISIGDSLYFKYRDKYGLILSYCKGFSLPSYEMGQRHFQQVLSGYMQFQQTKWINTDDFLPLYPMEKVCCSHITFLEDCLKKTKNLSCIRRWIITYLCQTHLSFFHQMLQSPLTLPADKITVIHGDFHNNNLLFNNEKLLTFLDFEEVGYGYPTEDLMRFILCLIQRLPIFIEPYSYVYDWMKCANKRFHFSKKEWIVGLNSYYLQRAEKVLSPQGTFGSSKQIIKLFKLKLLMSQYKNVLKRIHNL